MTEKILFVDDEANVLSALKRQFRKKYAVSTAESGAAAIKLITDEGPYAVIVSDMQMPEMNGVQFLATAQKLAPDSVRLMLTGNADQQTAIEAVNQGAVFSFYTKPCPSEVMAQAIDKAIQQHRLITAERELLEGTLNGSVKLLMDMLSMVAPKAFARTVALQEMLEELESVFELPDTCNLKLAAMLSNIACVTLPPETLEKTWTNEALSPQESLMLTRLPEVSKNLIANIPRLEKVSEIIFYQHKLFNGSGFPDDDRAGEDIPRESRILKVLHDFEDYKSQGMKTIQVMQRMTEAIGHYDPEILNAVSEVMCRNENSVPSSTIINTTLNGLRPGHVLTSDIVNMDGRTLFASGHKVTATIIERLFNYNRISKIKEPIQVSINTVSAAKLDVAL